MLNLEYPNSPTESINGYTDIYDYGNNVKLLLEDFAEARWELSNNMRNAAYKYRSCIVIAEMFTTPAQRTAQILDWTTKDYKMFGGHIYKILDCIYTYSHWESGKPADTPIINNDDYPKGFIVIDTGSYHECWTYICQLLSDDEVTNLYDSLK